MTSVFDAPCREVQAQMSRRSNRSSGLAQTATPFFRGRSISARAAAARLCVRSPEGSDQWVEGAYLEIVEPERVVFTGDLGFAGGTVTFRRA